MPLLILVLLALWRQRVWLTWAGVVWALGYLTLGVWQQHRATEAALKLAAARAHMPQQLLVKPAFGNLLLWKSVYRNDGVYYDDGHRAAVNLSHCGGDSVIALDRQRDLADLAPDSQQRTDIERFRWFSMDYLAPLQVAQQRLIIDVRYANLPHRVDPLWGIGIDSTRADDAHVSWWSNRRLNTEQRQEYQRLLSGQGCQTNNLPATTRLRKRQP